MSGKDPKKNGALGRSRTSDHLIRSQVLYPTELRARLNWTIRVTIFTGGQADICQGTKLASNTGFAKGSYE